MATAKQLPSGNWRIRVAYTDEDGQHHSASFTAETKRKAEALGIAWQEGMIEKERANRHLSVGQAIDDYIESCRCAGLSPSTILGYVSMRNNAFGGIEDRAVDRLTVKDVQRWINDRSRAVAPKTLKNNLGLLTATLAAEGIKLDIDALKVPRNETREMEIPSDAQVCALLHEAAGDADMFIAIALAALMGLRRSEICALHWADIHVDGDAAYLDVSRAVVRDENGLYVEKDPKTQAGRRLLAIPDALHAELKKRRSLRPLMVSLRPGAVSQRYALIAGRLGIPPRFHNLRHYHASVMVREGVPEKYITADMGHASFDMVRRVYGHVMAEKSRQIVAQMDTHAASLLEIATELPQAK